MVMLLTLRGEFFKKHRFNRVYQKFSFDLEVLWDILIEMFNKQLTGKKKHQKKDYQALRLFNTLGFERVNNRGMNRQKKYPL